MSETMTNVKERPILFSGEMVRAILDGRKTQTRRIVKNVPPVPPTPTDWPHPYVKLGPCHFTAKWQWQDKFGNCTCSMHAGVTPKYGLPGDRLWVREAWQITGRLGTEYAVWYPAGGEAVGIDVGFEGPSPKWDAMIHDDRVRPSIHMPRWACRITLEITDVRVERLHEISEADARAEGYTIGARQHPYGWYRDLWDTINGSGAWDANPWCWCISFKSLAPR
jgi:hypothetical protein